MVSRQRRWQAKQRALGNCTICGKPRGRLGNAVRCINCLRKHRAYNQKVSGHSPRYESGMGRKTKVERDNRKPPPGLFEKFGPSFPGDEYPHLPSPQREEWPFYDIEAEDFS